MCTLVGVTATDKTAREIADYIRWRLGTHALSMCRLLVALEEDAGHLAPRDRVAVERELLRSLPS